MTEWITVRDVELAYEVLGEETPALIWSHGLTSSRAAEDADGFLEWGRLAEHLPTVRYDALGHGESGVLPERDAYSYESLGRFQLALADALGIDRYVAGGASMGAGTSLHVAVQAPHRVAGLVLLIPPTAWETRSAQVELYLQMADIVEANGVEPLIKGAAVAPLPDPLEGHADAVDRAARRLRAFEAGRLATVLRGASTADLPAKEAVATLSMPTLILAWSGDTGHPLSTVDELTALLPHADSHVSSTWEDYRTWTDRIIDFLHRLDRSGQ